MRFHCFVFHYFLGAFASQKLVQGSSPRNAPPTREHSFFYFETHSPQSITIEIGEASTLYPQAMETIPYTAYRKLE